MPHISPRAIEAIKAALIQSRKDVIEGRKEFPTFDEQAVLVLTALEAEGMVVVPADLASRIWKDAENCVPTNWCDDLLTGPNCPKGPLNCPDVEKLLLGVIKRMRGKAALQAAQGGDDAGQ